MENIFDCLKSGPYEDQNGRRFIRYDGDVGIEIETESVAAYNAPLLKYWEAKGDGSLHDFGIEYVSKGALARGEELRNALVEWDTKINNKFKLKPDSFSTSVHIHINFMNKSWLTLANALTTYYLMENILIRFCGPSRRSNLFCMPLCDAEGILEDVLRVVRNIGFCKYNGLGIAQDIGKYAALNPCTLTRFGTMEVRSLEGTLDIDRIELWVNLLLKIVDFASVKGRKPGDIVRMADQDRGEMVFTVFGDLARAFDKIPNQNALIAKNLYFAAKIAGASRFTDDQWGFPKPKKVYKEKLLTQLEEASQGMFKVPYGTLPIHQKLVVDEYVQRENNWDRVTFEVGEL
jgi:hypothetical protein